MVVVFGRTHRDLSLRGAMGLHVPSRLHGIGVHENGSPRRHFKGLASRFTGAPVVVLPALGFELVDGGAKNFRDALGPVWADEFFNPHGQADLALAGQDVFPRPMKGERSGGAPPLDIHHGYALREQARFHHGGEAHLPTDTALPPLPHAAVAKPGLLDQLGIRNGQARVLHRVGVSPLRQVGK